ncbi:MAG: prepilin-type N-terminal cleavage/methylation domain-containing protein [Nanoarchaeota archaeon]
MGIRKKIKAFTLTELLIVIFVIGVLASLLLISLSLAQEKGRQTFCKNNLRQLSLTWTFYVDDNENRAPGNGYSGCDGYSESPLWVRGYLNNNVCRSDYTNAELLINPKFALLADYLKNKQVYKCPSDRKIFVNKSHRSDDSDDAPIGELIIKSAQKNRSYSLNWNLGWNRDSGGSNLVPFENEIIDKADQIFSPSKTYQFIDVYSESVCWVWFGIQKDKIIMFPAAYHNKSGNLSYIDGHIEGRKWRDSRTIDYRRVNFHAHGQKSEKNRDFMGMDSKSH